MSSKKPPLSMLFEADEKSSVIDNSKAQLKPLDRMGIRKDQIRDRDTLSRAVRHYLSHTQFSTRQLQALARRFDTENAPLVKKMEELMLKLSEVSKALDQGAPREPEPQTDPRTGFEDDPNPETRGKQHPHRSYRAG